MKSPFELRRGCSGFPPSEKQILPANGHRFIGMFYWCQYGQHWDELIDIKNNEFVVKQIGTDKIRHHRTPLWGNCFASQPF